MKRKIIGILVCMLMIGTTTIAVADWAPGDGFKMHFPQMPDPMGWDIAFHDWLLADDWQCTETGPVTDIHFWISWRGDIIGQLPLITVSIYSNNPGTGYSEPLDRLWMREFTPTEFIVAGPWTGDQGWFDPSQMLVLPGDHHQYFQINIKNIQQPFIQEIGKIYWLVIQMPILYPIEVGWKTTLDKFMDTAVWGLPGMWTPIINPMTGPVDLAFVITGGYPPAIPDLDCNGSIRWVKVKAGSTVTGNFTVKNIGQPTSLLDWEVSAWPSWGNWTFTPSSGVGLPAGGTVTVGVSLITPTPKNKKYSGLIEVRNKNNYSDNCTIAVYLQTPRTISIDNALFTILLQRVFRDFPVLHWILNPK